MSERPSSHPILHYSSDQDNEQNSTDSGVPNMSTNPSQNAVGGRESAGFQAPSNSGQPQHTTLLQEDHAKTVDEIFAFINEGFLSNENVPQERLSSTFVFGSSSQHSNRTSTHDPHIVHSPGLKSGNSVNFNRQESLKDPNPEKEMDEFLPEEKTVDFSLTSASWKGRTPPAQLVEIGIDDIPHFSFPPRSEESGRPQGVSVKDIPESGKHVRNIEVRRKDNFKQSDIPTASLSEDLGRPLRVKLPQEDLKENPKEPTKKRRKGPSSKQASTSKQSTMVKTSPSKHHRTSRGKVSDTVNATDEFNIYGCVTQGQTAPTNTASTSKRHEPHANTASTSKRHEPHINTASTSKRHEPHINTLSTSKRHEPHTNTASTSKRHEPHINTLSTSKRHEPHTNTASTSKRHEPITNTASTSKRHEPHINTLSTSKRHEPVHVRIDPRLSLVPSNLSRTKESSTKEDNIKVYVNVNVNMNKDKPSPVLDEFDFRGYGRPMLTELDSSDRSSSTLSENDYENSEFDSSTFSDRSLDINQLSPNIQPFQPSNNLSHLTIDRFRVAHKLGPGGLSPIPSESYESDTTNFQSDFSDLKRTPTTSDNSSDSTIKSIASVGDFDDEDNSRQVALASKRSSGKSKHRKISFKHDNTENDRYFDRPDEYKRMRSYSQPEQYLLDKRQNAFLKIEMGLPSEYYKRPSDPFSEVQNQKEHGRRPLSFRRSVGEESADRPVFFLDDDEPDSVISRQDLMGLSWNPRSPYSSRVSRTSSILSDSSRGGRRIRQLSVDIGEEWENIHPRPRTMSDVGSVSSGFSYRSLRKKRLTTEMLVGTEAMSFGNVPFRHNIDTIVKPGAMLFDDKVPDDIQVTEEIGSPVAEIIEDVKPITDVAGPVIIEVAEPEEEFGERSTKVRFLLDNPYNDINQKFHSALHCPCFLFFCFLCCAPAVYWMQRSDYEFDYASEKLAKRYGRRATALYITGIVLSILLFSAAIATTYFLLEKELVKKGHLK